MEFPTRQHDDMVDAFRYAVDSLKIKHTLWQRFRLWFKKLHRKLWLKFNKLLCRLGFHRWINIAAYQKIWVTGVDQKCLDCDKKRHIDYPNEGKPDISKYNFKVKRTR